MCLEGKCANQDSMLMQINELNNLLRTRLMHKLNGRYTLITLAYYSKLTLSPSPLSSCSNTLRDSGIPGCGIGSPLTIAS